MFKLTLNLKCCLLNSVPDDEADDAGGVEGAVGVVARGCGGRGGGVAGVQDVVIVQLALFVRTVGHGGPGEVDHVAGDAPGLQEAGLGHVLLDFGQDRDHADDYGQDLKG